MNATVHRVIMLLLLVLLYACNTTGRGDSKSSDFVTVNGTHFEVHGEQYYFVGTNLWYGCNLGSTGEAGDRERLKKELDLLQSLGITNLRVLGAAEGSTQHNTVNPAIQPELGVYDEALLDGLDFLLAEMGKRGMYAVVFLNNYWVWSGGMAQYISWIEGVALPNPFLPQYSWDQFMKFSGTFYTNEEANEAYKKYITLLINRKNNYTGVLYKNDPTIMSWQLANEPRPRPGENREEAFEQFIGWVNDIAEYIHSLDPNHLVSTGNEGTAGCLGSKECYLDAHRSEHIDYMTMHLWVLNWGWFDPQRPAQTYPSALEKAIAYMDEHIDYARQLGKPITFEEFGIPRDGHSYLTESPTTYRNRYFKALFDYISKSAADNSPMAGSNFWTWAGSGRAGNPTEAVWRVGDEFVGDPPQEPQGRNSVFDSDHETLNIIKVHARNMRNLNK